MRFVPFFLVLAAAARRITGNRATKSIEDTAASIPVPDANGVVENYGEHYPADRWVDPNAFVKASDTVEESTEGTFLGGVVYDMDERDVEWLEKNNSIARGEGSSTSPAATARNTPRISKSRASGGKDTTTDRPAFVITETEFELVMGLFEKFTEERFPYLHLVSNPCMRSCYLPANISF
jgi:enhancer of polycomb-like protein